MKPNPFLMDETDLVAQNRDLADTCAELTAALREAARQNRELRCQLRAVAQIAAQAEQVK